MAGGSRAAGGGPIRPPPLFVGRTAELARFRQASERVRLSLVYGVAGVGKTSLMLRCAAELSERVGGSLVYHSCEAGDGITTIARAVGTQLVGAKGGGAPFPRRDPVDALTRAAAACPVVVCVDDAHRADMPNIAEALVHLAAQRSALWVCVASREALAISPADIDHLVLRLGSLSPDEVRELWHELERLYGAAEQPFDRVAARGSITPWTVKRAFGQPADATDGEIGYLDGLARLEADLLAEACAFRGEAPLEALARQRDPAVVKRALRELTRRFLVEVRGENAVCVHDLVREAVHRSPHAPTTRHHERCLTYLRTMPGAGDDDTLALEILHHAMAAGNDIVALEILMRFAAPLRRLFPPGAAAEHELANSVDVLGTRRELPTPLQLLRARIRGRRGMLEVARADLTTLIERGETLAALDLGELAYAAGEPHAAAEHARLVVDRSEFDPLTHAWALALLVDAQRSQGEVAEAAETLASGRVILEQLGPLGEVVRASLDALIAHDCEDFERADRELAVVRCTAEVALAGRAPVPALASLERAIAAAAGRPTAGGVNADEFYDETLFFRLVARAFRVEELWYHGDLADAAAVGARVMEEAGAAGYRAVEWWAAWPWGEAERALGRPGSVVARLDEVVAAATRAGLQRAALRAHTGLARALLALGETTRAREVARQALADLRCAPGTAARLVALAATADALEGNATRALAAIGSECAAQGADREEWNLARCELLLWAGRGVEAGAAARAIERGAATSGWKLLACRARLLGAEAAFRAGDFAGAASAWEGGLAAAERGAFAAELLLAELLGASLARVRGDVAEAVRRLGKAAQDAAGWGHGPEAAAAGAARDALAEHRPTVEGPGSRLARRLFLLAPSTCRLRLPSGTYWLTADHVSQLELGACSLVVDLVSGRVRSAAGTVDLSRRTGLWNLMRVLSTRPGTPISTAVLVRAMWGQDYHPVRDHSRVTMAISRLRRLLGDKNIRPAGDGYLLAVEGSWAVIEPVAEDEAPRAT